MPDRIERWDHVVSCPLAGQQIEKWFGMVSLLSSITRITAI